MVLLESYTHFVLLCSSIDSNKHTSKPMLISPLEVSLWIVSQYSLLGANALILKSLVSKLLSSKRGSLEVVVVVNRFLYRARRIRTTSRSSFTTHEDQFSDKIKVGLDQGNGAVSHLTTFIEAMK